jgi:hypothetical protein
VAQGIEGRPVLLEHIVGFASRAHGGVGRAQRRQRLDLWVAQRIGVALQFHDPFVPRSASPRQGVDRGGDEQQLRSDTTRRRRHLEGGINDGKDRLQVVRRSPERRGGCGTALRQLAVTRFDRPPHRGPNVLIVRPRQPECAEFRPPVDLRAERLEVLHVVLRVSRPGKTGLTRGIEPASCVAANRLEQ